MQQHLADGLHVAAEAAVLASRTASRRDEEIAASTAKEELADALARFDDGEAHAAFDALLARLSIDALLRDVILRYLHDLGERWERNEVSIAQEHFASTLLRGRLLGLGARLGPRHRAGRSPRLCPRGTTRPRPPRLRPGAARTRLAYRLPRHRHPNQSVTDAARSCSAVVVVVSAVDPRVFRRHAEELQQLARETRLYLGGAGAARAGSTPTCSG